MWLISILKAKLNIHFLILTKGKDDHHHFIMVLTTGPYNLSFLLTSPWSLSLHCLELIHPLFGVALSDLLECLVFVTALLYIFLVQGVVVRLVLAFITVGH